MRVTAMPQMLWLRQTSDRPPGDVDKREGAPDDAAPTETAARAWGFTAPGRSSATPAGPLAGASRAGDELGSAATGWNVNHVAGWAEGAGFAGAAGEAPPPSGFSLNLATGQNAAGVIQTSGDLADAHWTVSNADNYKNGPIAYTVAPGDADWFNGWFADGPNSSWIAADPDTSDNGKVTYTITFDLTGYDPAAAALVGAQFAVDDQGYIALNGHVLVSVPNHAFGAFTAVPSGRRRLPGRTEHDHRRHHGQRRLPRSGALRRNGSRQHHTRADDFRPDKRGGEPGSHHGDRRPQPGGRPRQRSG